MINTASSASSPSSFQAVRALQWAFRPSSNSMTVLALAERKHDLKPKCNLHLVIQCQHRTLDTGAQKTHVAKGLADLTIQFLPSHLDRH